MRLSDLWTLLRETATRWWTDQGPRLGAALAFYTLLSLAPLLVVVTSIAGWFFGPEAARGQLVAEIRGLAGTQGAEVIQTTLASAYEQPGTGWFATLAGLALLLFGATGVFAELQDALNTIWGTLPRSTTVWGTVRDRFLSFSMVLSIAFLLMVSLVVSAGLAAFGKYASDWMPKVALGLQLLHFVLSIGLLTLLFALIYKFLPDAHIAWGDVWIGAAFTAVLFTIGKYLIGLYLGQGSFASAYGAAGSFAVFFVWVYYSAQILYFGAEFTQVYANRFGSRLTPASVQETAQRSSEQAERVTV